jgi:predicted nucleotidyltransferase component of viral defense system
VGRGRLTALQSRVLEVLAGFEPPLTLTGGGALVGFYLDHRTTRDLDLFLHGHSVLGDNAARVIDTLRAAGLQVSSTQLGTAMHKLSVSDASETLVVDLVADPVRCIEEPTRVAIAGRTLLVDTRHEILVNKICTLIQRSELRDLDDVRELLDNGGDLARALADAPRKDGGFSPLVLLWLLRQLPIRDLAQREAWSEQRTERVSNFRDALVERLAADARPEA